MTRTRISVLAGSAVLAVTVPGHARDGMTGTFTVR